MRESPEYHRHADECRALAHQLTGEARDQLIRMAETWEVLGRGPDPAPAKAEAEDSPIPPQA